jgi:hypothetical protein
MARTNDFRAFDRAPRELGAVVRTDILDGEILLTAAYHGNPTAAYRDGPRFSVRQVRNGPGIDPGRRFLHIIPVCRRASSDIML